MNFRGLYKTSLLDFPGRISAVLFTAGCNMRCHFCHNPDLAEGKESLPLYPEEDILKFLDSRRSLLEGIAITGGEPTLHQDMKDFLKKVQATELPVKLDTNGLRPDVLKDLIEAGLIEYVAMDIKTSPALYSELTGVEINFDLILESHAILRDSGIDYELRTTVVPDYVTLDILREIKETLGPVKRYCLQQYVSDVPMVDPNWIDLKQPYPVFILEEMCEFVQSFAEICEIRGI